MILTDSAKEKPMAGEILAVGAGRVDEKTGEVTPVKLQVGDRVSFFKYAGDSVETAAGDAYNIISETDVLCKM